MSTSLHTPLVPFAAKCEDDKRFAGRVQAVLTWPKRWWDDVHAPDLRAELGEREWFDIGAGARDFDAATPVRESADERKARRRAIEAWYGRVVH